MHHVQLQLNARVVVGHGLYEPDRKEEREGEEFEGSGEAGSPGPGDGRV